MKYVHWLKIDGYSKIEETASQFLSIENYLNTYPKAKAMLYEYDSGSFNCLSLEYPLRYGSSKKFVSSR